MAKKFHLRDGNIIHGSITEIIDGECKITTKEGILTIPMTDILEETVDIIKNDEARYKGPLLKEDRTSIVLRSNYGDVNINKKDIKKRKSVVIDFKGGDESVYSQISPHIIVKL